MEAAIFETPAWYRAQTLLERVRRMPQPLRGTAEPGMAVDADLIAKRMQQWRSETGLSDDQLFTERLESDGISQQLFTRALGESEASLQRHFPVKPEWLQYLETVYSRPNAHFSIQHHLDQPMAHIEFLNLIQPLIADAYARLRQGLDRLAQRHASAPFEAPSIGRTCLSDLCVRLRGMVARTLLLELQIRRLQGELCGDTPEARFADFVASLKEPGGLADHSSGLSGSGASGHLHH